MRQNKSKKSVVLTDKQKIFLDCYRKHAGDMTKVCSELRLSVAGYNRYLQTESVREQLNKSLVIARSKIEAALPFLVDKAIEMINQEEISDKTKSYLIGQLLDRGGLVQPKTPPIQVNINTEISDRARQILANTVDTVAVPVQI